MSTDENQVFLALQEWYQSDTYNLYQSDPQGVYYSIVLENVRSTKQPEENVLIDILEVRNVFLGEEFVILNSLCDITMGRFLEVGAQALKSAALESSQDGRFSFLGVYCREMWVKMIPAKFELFQGGNKLPAFFSPYLHLSRVLLCELTSLCSIPEGFAAL